MDQDDLSLVHRCKEGDARAFRVLVERYQRKAFSIAYGIVRDREEALDLTQEAFIKVHRYLDSFKGDSSFSTWLFRITSNLSIDRLRAKRRGEQVEFDESVSNEEAPASEAGILSSQLGTNPQKGALRRELGEKLEEALDALPPKHREIFVLRELEGLSYEELSERLSIPKGTVMSRLFHARAKLQAALADYLDGDDPEYGVGEREG